MRAIDFLQGLNKRLENTRISFLSAGLILLTAISLIAGALFAMAPADKAEDMEEFYLSQGLTKVEKKVEIIGNNLPSEKENSESLIIQKVTDMGEDGFLYFSYKF